MALPMNFTPGWQNRLRMDKESLFRIIDLTISVAASRWPDEFKQRRPHLVDQLFASSAAGYPKQRPTVSSSRITEPPKEDSALVSVLRDKQATQKTERPVKKRRVLQKTEPDHHHQRPLKKTTTVLQNREGKSKPSSTRPALEESEKQREISSISKLRDRYRAEEARKRKTQVIEFQKQSIITCYASTKKHRN